MKRHSPPRRGYGGRGRSPHRKDYGGGGRRRKEFNVSLFVKNIPHDCSTEELRGLFEKFGYIRDVYVPRNYYTRRPQGFGFVEFIAYDDASEAQYRLNGTRIADREITVTFSKGSRKNPEQMLRKWGKRLSDFDGRRSNHGCFRSRSVSRSCSPHCPSGSRRRYRSRLSDFDGLRSYHVSRSRSPHHPSGSRRRCSVSRSRSPHHPSGSRSRCSVSRSRSPHHPSGSRRRCSVSRSRSPHHPSGSRRRFRSRSYSHAPRGRGDYSVSPSRRHADYRPRPLRGAPRERDGERTRQLNSSSRENDDGRDCQGNRYHDKYAFEGESTQANSNRRSSHGRTRSRSPPKS